MDKIYRDANYIIAEINGDEYSFPVVDTWYSYNSSTKLFRIQSFQSRLILAIPDSEVTSIENESAVAYTVETLKTFLRENTGFHYV